MEFERQRNRRQRESPSFSSTLLDSIYRSIDDGTEDHLVLYREETMRNKHCSNFAVHGIIGDFGDAADQQAIDNLRRACLIEKWMEKKVTEKVVVRRKADFERRSRSEGDHSLFLKSSSSSSDSSCGGGFSSSEGESVSRPKPMRTSVSVNTKPAKVHNHEKQQNAAAAAFGNRYQQNDNVYNPSTQQKPKQEGGGFVKTKSRALKIYGDLNKKVKQPISPGGKLATFLNSLFTAGNAKKAEISSSRAGGLSYDDAEKKSKSAHASTCSSASSFSRSCLSKTPSSRGKLSNGMKRSVRFYPVSVIGDEDCQPCGHKSLYGSSEESNLKAAVQFVGKDTNKELKVHLNEKNRRVEEAARDLLKNYQKKVECEFDLRDEVGDMDEDDEDDDEDAASYASSDLFELDNLSAIGIERYRDELPVYGTTHFDTNRAIAHGLIM